MCLRLMIRASDEEQTEGLDCNLELSAKGVEDSTVTIRRKAKHGEGRIWRGRWCCAQARMGTWSYRSYSRGGAAKEGCGPAPAPRRRRSFLFESAAAMACRC